MIICKKIKNCSKYKSWRFELKQLNSKLPYFYLSSPNEKTLIQNVIIYAQFDIVGHFVWDLSLKQKQYSRENLIIKHQRISTTYAITSTSNLTCSRKGFLAISPHHILTSMPSFNKYSLTDWIGTCKKLSLRYLPKEHGFGTHKQSRCKQPIGKLRQVAQKWGVSLTSWKIWR